MAPFPSDHSPPSFVVPRFGSLCPVARVERSCHRKTASQPQAPALPTSQPVPFSQWLAGLLPRAFQTEYVDGKPPGDGQRGMLLEPRGGGRGLGIGWAPGARGWEQFAWAGPNRHRNSQTPSPFKPTPPHSYQPPGKIKRNICTPTPSLACLLSQCPPPPDWDAPICAKHQPRVNKKSNAQAIFLFFLASQHFE